MPVIEVSNLRKRYRDHLAVDDVSFTVERGEIFGILGPNGAGKTTTVECIGGLRRPDGGSVSVLGLDPRRDRAAITRCLGMQLQDSQLPDRITVQEALGLYSSFYDDPADWCGLLNDLGLEAKRRTEFRRLSGGQRQRLSIALALIGKPQIAILDELTTGLDPQARADTWQLIEEVRRRGVTVVLVTHLMEEAERLCDRLAVIDRGRVVTVDTPSGLLTRSDAEHRVSFVVSGPLDAELLSALPEVRRVQRTGVKVDVTGTGDLLTAVTSVLARNQITVAALRFEQASLDDAFIAITSRERGN